MKIVLGMAAALVVATIIGIAPAQAQRGGSYLRSCGNVEERGDTLIATCRNRDGASVRSALDGVRACAGDIGNNNGILQCQYRDGRQGFGRVVAGGPPPVYAPPAPGYGRPPYVREGRERCRELREEAERLRYRLDREWDPRDRERISYRLREIHEQEERCR